MERRAFDQLNIFFLHFGVPLESRTTYIDYEKITWVLYTEPQKKGHTTIKKYLPLTLGLVLVFYCNLWLKSFALCCDLYLDLWSWQAQTCPKSSAAGAIVALQLAALQRRSSNSRRMLKGLGDCWRWNLSVARWRWSIRAKESSFWPSIRR